MTMERIVRPFQLGEVFTARVLPPVEQPAVTIPEDIVQVWGKGNDTNYDRFFLSGIVGGVVHYTEKERTTQVVRITNPDDAEQFVDVERIRKLRMVSDRDGSDINFDFSDLG